MKINNRMSEKLLYFDAETTGLIPEGLNYWEDYEQYPYLVKLSWLFNGEMKDYVIYPSAWEIPEYATEIHGISQNKALMEGHYFNDVIIEFINDCKEADKLIGYNLYFDVSVIKANILRSMPDAFMDLTNCALNKKKRFDLMFKVIKFVGARQRNGSGKFPSLVELYWKLFRDEFDAHDSKEDVLATEKCYLELLERGII